MEENLFPSQMMITSRADLEEERRLFYVAITRAEKKLTLSYATSRYQWGNLRSCEKSRFLDEIDPQFVNFKFCGRAGQRASRRFSTYWSGARNLIPPAPRKTCKRRSTWPRLISHPPIHPTCKAGSALSTPSLASAWSASSKRSGHD